jgi:ferrous iron transport protein B
MKYTFALLGNPNCGKTTMFNEITGSTQYVGNWPGVTVEKKEGKARKFKEDIKIVDLPGIYSLSPYSMEEIIARDYLLEEKPDVVINIVEGTNIERNLYLTTQLLELGIPVIMALNMMDAVEARGDKINVEILEKALGVLVVPTSARKGLGVQELIEKALKFVHHGKGKQDPPNNQFYDVKIEKVIRGVERLIKDKIGETYNSRWVSLKLLEGDEKIKGKYSLPQTIVTTIEGYGKKLEQEEDNDFETIIADHRYRTISKILGKAYKKNTKIGLTRSDKIDQVVTHRLIAIPFFLFLMFGIFQITFGSFGFFTIDLLDVLFNEKIAGLVGYALEIAGGSPWLIALIVDGIIAGVGSVLVFVPQIMLLFFFLSILEDSGYMARAAFVMDRLLRKLGLTGKSFIPMLMGFGCSVPAVMAARTLENEKDRKLTIILTPFMSCGARLPIYALFAAAFFSQNQSLVIFSIYLLGIVVAVLSGILLTKTVLKGEAAPFVMELPPYRVPTLKGLMIHMWDRGKGFVKKAGTVIFAASVVIWFFQSFSFTLQMVENPEESILGVLGRGIAPLFAPLGFGDWKSAVALLTGLVAKEVVVATMGILHGIGEMGENPVELSTALQSAFTPLKAYAFMAFTLLYMPCIAAFGAIKREMNSWKWTWFAVGYQTGVAWLVAFLIFQIGSFLQIGS